MWIQQVFYIPPRNKITDSGYRNQRLFRSTESYLGRSQESSFPTLLIKWPLSYFTCIQGQNIYLISLAWPFCNLQYQCDRFTTSSMTFNDLDWPWMTIEWPWMTLNDLEWHYPYLAWQVYSPVCSGSTGDIRNPTLKKEHFHDSIIRKS